MKEIKFRAWNNEKKIMKYQEKDIDGLVSISEFFDELYATVLLEDLELMQFTGLKDKNGKEIYEGDIVKFFIMNSNTNKSETMIGVCMFKEGSYMIDTVNESNYYLDRKDIKVVGNKFENPELIGEK